MSQEVVHRWFIAVELGAEWPEWMTELVGGSARRVVAQVEGEQPERFVERSLGIAATTHDIGDVLVLCNERADIVQSEARQKLVGGLVRRGLARNARRLVAAPARSSARLKQALEALGGRSQRRNDRVEVCIGAPRAAQRAASARHVARVA